MEISMATSKITGNKTPEASDRTQGLISGAPGEEWYWILTYVSDGAYVTTFIVMDIQITYDVEFFDRNEIDRSSLEGQQSEALYEQLYQLRIKALGEQKRPHNDQLPWNRARDAKAEDSKKIESIELKEEADDYAHVSKPKLVPLVTDLPQSKAPIPSSRSSLRR
jgi:hypothetical protein